MSLTAANAWGWMVAHKKLIGIFAGLVVLLLGVLFLADKCSTWRSNREIRKDREAINAKLSNIANRQSQIDVLTGEQNVEKQEANAMVANYVDARAADRIAREEAQKAAANVQKAKEANTTNSSVEDLQRVLDKLDGGGNQ